MLPLTLGLAWLVIANLAAMLPSRDHHWRAAYGLIATGLPLFLWIAQAHGALWTVPFLAAAGSVLRWPLWVAWTWLTRQGRG
jgi:hypothetical protein